MMLLATIQHSGTMQTLKILGRPTRPLAERHKAVDGDILFTHLHDRAMPLIEAHDDMIITTRRPAEDIRASWERRGKNLADLEGQLANYERLLFLQPYVLELGRWR